MELLIKSNGNTNLVSQEHQKNKSINTDNQDTEKRYTDKNKTTPEDKNIINITDRKLALAPKNTDEFFNQLENITQAKAENFNKELKTISSTNNKFNIIINAVMGISTLLFSGSITTLGIFLVASLASSVAIAGIGCAMAFLLLIIGIIIIKCTYNSLDKSVQASASVHGISALLADIFCLYDEQVKQEFKRKFNMQNVDYTQLLKQIEQSFENPNIIKIIKELRNECLNGLNITNETKVNRIEKTRTELIKLTENMFDLLFENIKQGLADKEQDFTDFAIVQSLKSYSDKDKTRNMLDKILSSDKIKQSSNIIAKINFGNVNNYDFVVDCITEGVNNYISNHNLNK